MSNILEQAQVAASSQNWPFLVQCLQQLSVGEGEPLEIGNLEVAVSLAIQVLAEGDFQDRWDIAKVLPNFGTSTIAPLIAIVEDEDADTEARTFAARILGKFDRPEAIAALVKSVKNSDEELSQTAAQTLASLGPLAIESLSHLLLEKERRLFATAALAQIRHSETIAPLLSVVTDSQDAVRATAIEAISSFHDPRISAVLIAALKDPATAVRKEAARALGVRAYLNAEFDLVNLLKPLLWDVRLEVCSEAVMAVGRLKTDAAAAVLFELLRSPATPMQLQIETVRALSWMETATALRYLQQALIAQYTNTNHSVFQEIVALLGRVEKLELKAVAAEILLDLLKTSHPAVQEAGIKKSLALGLGKLGDMRGVDALISMLGDADNSVRLHCTAALKQLGNNEVRQKLESLLKQENLEPRLKQGIAIALQEWQE